MRYLFHVVGDGCIYLDEVGTHFSSPEKAEAHAVAIASELASDGDSYLGFEVCVVDHRANELARVPVAGVRVDEPVERSSTTAHAATGP